MAPLYSDTPLSLIPTPHSQTGKTDQFTMDASRMAVVHNVIVRGYNSIYQQAPHLKSRDYPDFIGYSLAWQKMVQDHHDSEEAVLFPSIEKATGVQGIMNGEVTEHATFHNGLEEFKTYLNRCAKTPTNFQAAALLAIMDTFGRALQIHLANEPPRLASLIQYPIDMQALSEKTAKHSMEKTSAVYLLPMLWFNLDLEFEDGKWKGFPPVPWPVRWVMVHVLGWWRSNWWRFGSCGADGKRVLLLTLRDDYRSSL